MFKTIATLTALTLATGTLAACESAWPTSKPPGTYKASTSSTAPDGTKTTTDQTTHVYRDADGNKKAVVQTETSRDPKGLFNKETSKTTKSYN